MERAARSGAGLIENYIPQCSPDDGLYLEVQASSFPKSQWCVNRFTGKKIAGTSHSDGKAPVCPGTW